MKKISILVPTRKRFDSLIKSVDSLFNNCYDINNFEVLIAVDNDDVETTEKIKTYFSNKKNVKIFCYERQFYHGINNYYNDLAIKSTGTSLLLWNDDATIKTKNWDVEILEHHKEFCILSPKVDTMESYWENQGVLFPILPKKWIELTGKWSEVPACDSWIDVLGKRLNLTIKLESVVISHERADITGDNLDETYLDGRQDIQNPNFFNKFHTWHNTDDYYLKLLEEHYQKIFTFINNNDEK